MATKHSVSVCVPAQAKVKLKVILAQSNLITERQRCQINHTPDTAITTRHD